MTSWKAYMNSLGFRPRGDGKHFNTFRFVERALPDGQTLVRRLQRLRRRRNLTIYEQAGTVSEKEAREVIDLAARYYTRVEEELAKPRRAHDEDEVQ